MSLFKMMWVKDVCMVLFLFHFSQGCYSDDVDWWNVPANYDDPEVVLNTNIKSIRQLVHLLEKDIPIASVDSSDTHAYV